MSMVEAIIMGVVQGLTEFLPVSSSGHLAIARSILGLELDNILFEVLLHMGTLIAIVAVYARDVIALIGGGLGIIGRFIQYLYIAITNLILRRRKGLPRIIHNEHKKLVMLIIVASIPTAIIGLLLEKAITEAFDRLLIPGICLLVTGGLLYTTNKIATGNKRESKTTYRDATIIGIFQGLAGLPGISRSGSTIVAGLLRGLHKEFAVKFSFLMSLPAVVGAMLLQLKDMKISHIPKIITAPYLIGTAVSACIGYVCIRFLIRLIKHNKLHYFAYYCFALGIMVVIAYFIGA